MDFRCRSEDGSRESQDLDGPHGCGKSQDEGRNGVNREILSQVPKFMLNRGEMPLADDSDKKVERTAQPQRAGMMVGG